MDEKRTDLRPDLRTDLRTDLKTALRELGAEGSGPHPGMKRLLAYRQDTLPAAEREALQEHLSLCSRCTGLLREARDFEAAADSAPAAGPEKSWESLLRRLPRETPAARPAAGPAPAAPSPRPGRRAPLLAYAAAAMLLISITGLSVWTVAIQRERGRLTRVEQRLEQKEREIAAARRSLAEAERQLGAARGHLLLLEREKADTGRLEARIAELTAELEELRRSPPAPPATERIAAVSRDIEISVAPRFALRGHEAPELLREGGAVNPVPLSDRIVLVLSLPDHAPYEEYRLELVDREGRTLWTGRRQAGSLLGDAGTSVAIQGLGPGRYRLRIEGLRPQRGRRLAEYVLDVGPG